MSKRMICIGTLTVLVLVTSAQSGVPPLMNYQGKLTDEYGVPVSDGDYTIWFRIYTDSVGGDVLWAEEQWSVSVNGGLFSVLLGSVEDIPDTVFTGPIRWLGVQVSPDPELSPRKPIISVAYAFRSAKTDTADYALNAARDDDWFPDTSGLHIYRPAGNVGIGMVSLESKLEVAGTTQMTGFKMSTGASDGYVLTSDGSGVGSWQAVGSGSGNWDLGGNVLHPIGDYGISMRLSNVLYGIHDSTHVCFGVACTTGGSGIDHKYCTVSGGYGNRAEGFYPTAGGGRENHARQNYATVSGGYGNLADGIYASVGGGHNNTAQFWGATVSGGRDNTATDWEATVGGGQYNRASDDCATVGGGLADTASGPYATVSGGWGNTASDTGATVSGGKYNYASTRYATVGGGYADTVSHNYATVSGGYGNMASGLAATVSGGWDNSANQFAATVSGGTENEASGSEATVGGGNYNIASGSRATVSGGHQSIASNQYSTVGGGEANGARADYATVGGGHQNGAFGYAATIGGGYENRADDTCATVTGGRRNTASGDYATVAGGYADTVAGDYSFAVGRHVVIDASADYTFAFGRDFTTSTPNAVIFHNSVDVIKVGAGTPSPSATLDVNGPTGYNQVRMRTSYSPTATSDTLGNVGDIAWDDDYMYIKTSGGWKRAALNTW